MRRGLVLGAGGVLGYTWSVCALHRFATTTGWDARRAAALVGTSAGSIIATALAAGVSTADLLAHQRRPARREGASHLPPWPHRRPLSWSLARAGLSGKQPLRVALAGLLPEGRVEQIALAAAVDGLVEAGRWVDHPSCWLVAMDADSGDRVAFGRAGAPPAGARDAARASCAVPGWFAPVNIGGRRYVDGGVVSATSADLLAGEALDEVVVISPMTSRGPVPAGSLAEGLERLLRRRMSRALEREVAALEAAGVRVIRIEPTAAELRVMGPNFMDPRRRQLVLNAWFPS